MEVQKEAQRIMTMSVWKMYHSRMQRGGLRLHRSLQLSLVMRNARDLYLSAKLEEEEEEEEGGGEGEMAAGAGERAARLAQEEAPPAQQGAQAPSDAEPEPMETQEEEEEEGARPLSRTPWTRGPAAKPSRKRRSSSLGKMGAADDDDDAGLVPSKKAKLAEEGEEERPTTTPPPQGQEGPFPSLARVLQDRFSGLILSASPTPTATTTLPTPTVAPEDPKGSCRQGEGVLSILVRAVVAF